MSGAGSQASGFPPFPPEDHPPEDRARPTAARRPLFLGGPVSALLVGAALELDGLDACAWFGLLPLLIALDRNRGRPWLRACHGLSFGLLLAIWNQGWFFDAMLDAVHAAPGDGRATITGALTAGLGSVLAWSALALFPGLFAVAAGAPLRARSAWVPVVSLPLLWMGLEVGRGPLSPLASPWLSGWLSLGYAFDTGAESSLFAAAAGVHGLGAAAVLVSTLLLLAVRPAPLRQQVLWTGLALAVPATVFAWGTFTGSEREPAAPTRPALVGLVVHQGTTGDAQIELARAAARGQPSVIVWPGLRVAGADVPPDDQTAILAEVARAFATVDERGTALTSPRGGLVAWYATPPGRDREIAPPHRPLGDDRVVATSAGTCGVGVGAECQESSGARRQASAGAELLVWSGVPRQPVDTRGGRQQIAMLSYRAIENRRWVAAAGPSGALLVDPYGQTSVELPGGASCGATGRAAWVEQASIYTAWGWWLEPLALVAAVAVIMLGAWPARRALA